MREARTPVIPDRVVEVLRGPAVMLVGSRDAALRPAHTCAVGAIVDDDQRTVTFFVPESRSARLLSDLRDNGRVAFSFGWASHEAYQLKGTYLTCLAFGKRMARRGRGSIVTIASITGMRSTTLHAYAPAKAAVINLSAGLAAEWGRSGVRVNAISPGYTLIV